MRYVKLTGVLVVMGMVLIAGNNSVRAQARANFQWDGVAVKDALAALNRQFQLNYSLPNEVGQRKITASLVNAAPEEAFRTILDAANLTAVNDGGVWRIRDKPQRAAAGQRTWPQQTQSTWGQPGMAAPVPFRQPPGQVQLGAGAQAQAAEIPEQWDPKNCVMRIIPLKSINPWLVVDIFGGIGLSEEDYTGGGGGGGGGYGGSGGSSRDYGRGGSNQGGRGGYDQGGRGGSRSSSSRSSSSRSSSSRSSYGGY